MFLERKEEEKLHKGTVLVGYDLGEKYSQISYCIYGQSEIETVATVVGTKQYNIPTLLCKRKGVNQWYYGKDAVKYYRQEDMIAVENLLSAAEKGEMLSIDGEEITPIALLTLFLKRSLTLMNFIAPIEKIGAIMFTVDKLSDRMVEVLLQAVANLNLKTKDIYIQSHTESFYSFVLHQPKELWMHQVVACEHDGRVLKTYRLECNRRTTPIVVLIEEQSYETLVIPEDHEPEEYKKDAYALADERFLGILKKQFEGRLTSAAYLLGDGFRNDWHEKSLQFLCHNRRVFQGNNLFSQGACHGLIEKLDPGEISKSHIFLGKDKLKSNIGLNVIRQGKPSYYALLDAGENWYEIQKNCEIFLEGDKEIAFVITPLTGKNPTEYVMELKDAKVTEAPITRYEVEICMTSAKTVKVKVIDFGFGELFPATYQVWEEVFEVS